MNKIWVYIDQYKGQPLATSWEGIGAAKTLAAQLGGGVTALVFGKGVEPIATQAFQYGADEVLLADDPSLEDYRAEPYTTLLAKLAAESSPEIILFPTTTRGRELSAMVAIDLNTGVLPDVIALEVEGGSLLATRPIYAGKLLCKVKCLTKPQLVTLRGRAFTKPALDTSRSGNLTRVNPVMGEADIPTKVEAYAAGEAGVSLTDASVIVSGGRGVSNNPKLTPPAGMDEKQAEIWKAQQGFKLIEELAQVLHAAVGASRAAVDAGYIPYAHQVGQTGKVVSPDMYIACGISGAIQHQAGMRTSKVIVAINRDPEAPIFKLARYGVAGDLYAIIPALTEALRKRLGK
ncbi:MAG TPA: electron transfer flavoprotein subunit alpha/FixB family protein [Anaerolineales bacterium]|nr:electron transfer flavoprotein subunit alpha/FixB family protein [Anaerolineales bacterium]